MRHRVYTAAAAAAIVIAVLAAGWGGRAQVPARKSWEYKVVTAQFGAVPASLGEQEMNRLGAEGWELVGTRATATANSREGQYRTDYFFKRQR